MNTLLLEDMTVTARYMSQAQALDIGAMALFGEKYGDTVRVVSVGDWAHELCGGTHAHRSGQLGVVSFISEGSIGSGVRRVEALVGSDAYHYLAREHLLVSALSTMLKSPREDLVERVGATVEKLKNAERELARLKQQAMMANLDTILGEGRQSAPSGCGPCRCPMAPTASSCARSRWPGSAGPRIPRPSWRRRWPTAGCPSSPRSTLRVRTPACSPTTC